MSDEIRYEIRAGNGEFFVKAPGDQTHRMAFELVTPGAVYDALIEEWRVTAEDRSIEDLSSQLRDAVFSLSSVSISDQLGRVTESEYGYASVTEGERPEEQIDPLRERGIPDKRIFLDRLTGRHPKRPKLVECLENINYGDAIVVCSMVGLARSLKQFAETAEVILAKNAHLYSISESIDTKDPCFQNFLQNIVYAAHFERNANSVRTKAGIKEASRQGRKKGGRPSSLTRKKIELIMNMILDGMQMTKIAELAETSRATIYRHIAGAPESVIEANNERGSEGVNELIDQAVAKLKEGVTQTKRENVVRMYKLDTNIDVIADNVRLNRETVRAIIESAYK
jgi:DNA invertase Pin-like site-specific DNA recombinase